MNPINKVYGDFIIHNLNDFEIIICGTLTFKGRSKDIAELRWRMDRFKEERLVKYRITSSCYWVVEKMNNNDNHIHFMIGVQKDGYKDVDDYCNIFGGYWKNFGSCLFEEYQVDKGIFQNYMFKNFIDWEFFETEFGNSKNNNNFVLHTNHNVMDTKRTGFLQFVKIIESKKNVYEKKDVKTSLISYLKSELQIIETEYKDSDLILKLLPGKDGKSRKSIRCWGDVDTNGERKLILKCFNERVYASEEDAKNKKSYGFNNSSKDCVIDTLKNIIKTYEVINNDDIVLWYNYKNEDRSIVQKLISDKIKNKI